MGRAVAAAHGGLNGQLWYANILGGSYFAEMVCCVPARTAMCENGYVCKECGPEQFVRAIRTVALGRRYVSPAVGDQLAPNADTTYYAIKHGLIP